MKIDINYFIVLTVVIIRTERKLVKMFLIIEQI